MHDIKCFLISDSKLSLVDTILYKVVFHPREYQGLPVPKTVTLLVTEFLFLGADVKPLRDMQ